MTTGLIYDERFLDHDTGPHHPERPDRLRAINTRLKATGLLDRLQLLAASPVDSTMLARVHTAAYLTRLDAACEQGKSYIDTPDSAICAQSADIARLAAGGVSHAVDCVMAGEIDNAFCAVRPPGHHAERDQSMGFCLLANAAIAAERMAGDHRLKRVAIVDFDVHHGNGTQHMFEERSDVLFISLHEDPTVQYPGSGFVDETGRGAGEGFTLNLPMATGAGDEAFQRAFDETVIPRLNAFSPEAMILSAGFDASAPDPLGHLNVTPAGFAWMTRQLLDVAATHAGGRVVSLLEGGYDLDSLADCVEAHVRELLAANDS